jgi:hypothetical protein
MTCKTSENKALQELKKILKICSFSKSVNYKMKDAKRFQQHRPDVIFFFPVIAEAVIQSGQTHLDYS